MSEAGDAGLWTGIGGILLGIGSAITAWWKLRKDKREDAVDSASAKAHVDIIETQQKLINEMQGRLKDLDVMEQDYYRAIADLRTMYRNQDRLTRKLKRAGVEDSEIGTLIDDTKTDFAKLESIPTPKP